MTRVNIGCARCIGIKLRRAALLAFALLGAPLLAALAPDEPKPDPAFPFSREVETFAQRDRQGAAQVDATLFLGSSSIRLWDIGRSFPGIATVNRGFGGATTPDVLHHYRRLLPATPPRAVIVYVGENDLAGGATPEAVARQVLDLLGRLRADYPRARIAYLSLKPSPIRWTLWPQLDAVNRAVGARARSARFDYIDVGHVLLARDGLPDASLFGPDGLHMNGNGYARWTRLVRAYLDRAPTVRRDLNAVASPSRFARSGVAP